MELEQVSNANGVIWWTEVRPFSLLESCLHRCLRTRTTLTHKTVQPIFRPSKQKQTRPLPASLHHLSASVFWSSHSKTFMCHAVTNAMFLSICQEPRQTKLRIFCILAYVASSIILSVDFNKYVCFNNSTHLFVECAKVKYRVRHKVSQPARNHPYDADFRPKY